MRIDAYTHFMPSRIFKKLVDSGYPGHRQAHARSAVHPRSRHPQEGRRHLHGLCADPLLRDAAARGVRQGRRRAGRGIRQADQRRASPKSAPRTRIISPAGWRKARSARRTPASREAKRAIEDGRARRADLHQCRRQAARRSGVRAVLRGDGTSSTSRSGCIRRATPSFADYASEKKSKYEIWWTFGWSYETAAAMARLVFSKIMDKYPKLKIITHHFGGIVPMLEGRIGPGWDQLGARTSDEDLTRCSRA